MSWRKYFYSLNHHNLRLNLSFVSSFACQVGVIDNNGVIDGLKDPSQPKVNSEFCFEFIVWVEFDLET